MKQGIKFATLSITFLVLILACTVQRSISQTVVDDNGQSVSDYEEFLTGFFFFEWMSPVEAAAAEGLGNFQDTIFLISPDSNARFINSEGQWDTIDLFSAGHVFDATDKRYQLVNNGENLWEGMRTSVDSFKIPYLYHRRADSILLEGQSVEVVDTLVVQIFDQLGIDVKTTKREVSEVCGVLTNYDSHANIFTDQRHEFKILLRRNHETGSFGKSSTKLKVLNVEIPPPYRSLEKQEDSFENRFAFNVAFRPMIAHNPGDTLFALNGYVPRKRHSHFGVKGAITDGLEPRQIKHLNNSVFVFSEPLNSELDSYFSDCIPGNALTRTRFMYSYIRAELFTANITTGFENEHVLFRAAPNPVSNRLNIYVADNSILTELVISDLYGTEIRRIDNEQLSIDVSDLLPGVYLLQGKINGIATSVRFVKSAY